MKDFIYNFIKGMGMGAANVIPGVSGGTIALITGIFERLINSIKSFNLTALKLFFTGHGEKYAVEQTLLTSASPPPSFRSPSCLSSSLRTTPSTFGRFSSDSSSPPSIMWDAQ